MNTKRLFLTTSFASAVLASTLLIGTTAYAKGGKQCGGKQRGKPSTEMMQKCLDRMAEKLGLSPEEYAFYTILAKNSSTAFLEDHKMKELIHLIVEIIRKNATVDWNKRDDVKAKLRLLVRKVLMKYGYPPYLPQF